MHKNAPKNSVFGPVISRRFLHYLYTSPQNIEISMVRGVFIFFHSIQHHPLCLSNALAAPPKMHQNAVFGALVGGFMHEFPDFGSVPGRQVPKIWIFIVLCPVFGSVPGHQMPKYGFFLFLVQFLEARRASSARATDTGIGCLLIFLSHGQQLEEKSLKSALSACC